MRDEDRQLLDQHHLPPGPEPCPICAIAAILIILVVVGVLMVIGRLAIYDILGW